MLNRLNLNQIESVCKIYGGGTYVFSETNLVKKYLSFREVY